jgi:5,10-methylenetetrahydromethanopterin reductase
MSDGPRVSLLIPDFQSAADTLRTASLAEAAGFEEVWVPEDYFLGGGVATAAAVLATTKLSVGLGVLPAGGRHPAVLALDLAALAEMFPRRAICGIGAGIPEEMTKIGARARSPLGAVGDTVRALRLLLEGGTLTVESETFTAADVSLGNPPAAPPALFVGAGGPKMLALAGAVADGTVLSVLSGPEYIGWAREQISAGGAASDHRVVAYVLCAIDDDPDEARGMLREMVAYAALPSPRNPLSEQQGFADEAERLAALDLADAIAAIPDRWLEELVVAGTPRECRLRIEELHEAGADTIALCLPAGAGMERMLSVAGDSILAAGRLEA